MTKVLFVCARNQWRSPTAENLYRRDQRLQVRSVGLSPKSRRRIKEADLDWADLVLVMESEHKSRLLKDYSKLELPSVVSLDIPDDYPYMDPELISRLTEEVEDALESYLCP